MFSLTCFSPPPLSLCVSDWATELHRAPQPPLLFILISLLAALDSACDLWPPTPLPSDLHWDWEAAPFWSQTKCQKQTQKTACSFKKKCFSFFVFPLFYMHIVPFFSFFFFFFIFFELTNNPPSLDRRCQRALLPRPLSETVGLVLIQQTEGELWLRGVLASAQSLFIRWFCFSI